MNDPAATGWKIFRIACLAGAPLLCGYYSIMLGQDINWDLQNYHLYNPYSFIHDRIHVDLAPAGLQTYFNPFLDILYYKTITLLSPKSTGFLIGFIQGLSFIFIYKAAIQILGKGRDVYAIILAATGLLSVGFLSEIGTTLHDSLLGTAALASLWLCLSAIGDIDANWRRSAVLLGVSGAVIGVVTGLKLVFAMYALALLLGLLIVPVGLDTRIKATILFGLCAFVGLQLAGGYWFYKMWVEFGNPLFPQFNNIFQGELASFESARDVRFLPKNLYEKVFYPFLFTFDSLRVSELPYKQVNWIFGYLALLATAVAMLAKWKKPAAESRFTPQAVMFVSFFGISYLVWVNLFGIYRYLVPIEVLIPLLVFLACDYFLKEDRPRYTVVAFLSMTTAANVTGAPDWWRSTWGETVYHAESSLLTSPNQPAAIYLLGQPLAWLIPALDIDTPFIQLTPNMSVSASYWSRATELTNGRHGDRYVLFDSGGKIPSESAELTARINTSLSNLDLVADMGACNRLDAYLGTSKREYWFCRVHLGSAEVASPALHRAL